MHDGAEACVEGDCVRILPGYITSKWKTHIVAEIVSPMRTGQERKAVESVEEWVAKREAKRRDKDLRREARRLGMVKGLVEGVGEVGKEGEEGERKVLV